MLVGFGMFGAMMSLPLYLQLVNGATPTEAGLLLLPLVVGLMISSMVGGQLISRTGRYKIFPILGTGMLAAGFIFLTFSSYDKPVIFTMVGHAHRRPRTRPADADPHAREPERGEPA